MQQYLETLERELEWIYSAFKDVFKSTCFADDGYKSPNHETKIAKLKERMLPMMRWAVLFLEGQFSKKIKFAV